MVLMKAWTLQISKEASKSAATAMGSRWHSGVQNPKMAKNTNLVDRHDKRVSTTKSSFSPWIWANHNEFSSFSFKTLV
jgi:hypothetical protein